MIFNSTYLFIVYLLYSKIICIQINLYSYPKPSIFCIQNILWIFCIRDLLEQDIPVIFASVKEVTIMKTAVIYARVSSSNDRQNTQRQIEDLTHFASRNEYQLMGTYEEHISGATKNEKIVLTTALRTKWLSPAFWTFSLGLFNTSSFEVFGATSRIGSICLHSESWHPYFAI